MGNTDYRGSKTFEIANMLFLGILAVITIFPFYNVFILSFAKYEVVVQKLLYILPESFDFTSYGMIIREPNFYNSVLVTLFVVVAGTTLNMALTVGGAYALSKKKLPGRNIILMGILFTMFFNGGLIPYYLIVKSLGMVNSLLVMVIPTGITTMYLIIVKNYFNTIPESMEESAKIDGANDIYILIKIIIPLSAPIIATFGLFYAVDRWNDWWYAMIFINQQSKVPLQIFLRQLLVTLETSQLSTIGAAIRDTMIKIYMPGVRMAGVVLSIIPIAVVYPFLQKYFVRGIMMGSLKE